MIYLYKCPVCAERREVIKPLVEIDREEGCSRCGAAMNRQLTAPAVLGDLPGYECPITGNWIQGRRQHEENLRKHNCRVLESGERDEVFARRRSEDDAADRMLEEDVGRQVAALPHEKRQRLEEEISHGFDLGVTRATPH